MLVRQEKSIHTTVKRNNFSLFKRPHANTPSRKETQFQEMKSVTCLANSSLLLRSMIQSRRSFSHMKISLGHQHCHCMVDSVYQEQIRIVALHRSKHPARTTITLWCKDFSLMRQPWCIFCHIETRLRLANIAATQPSFIGQRGNCKAAVELTLYGIDTVQIVWSQQLVRNEGKDYGGT